MRYLLVEVEETGERDPRDQPIIDVQWLKDRIEDGDRIRLADISDQVGPGFGYEETGYVIFGSLDDVGDAYLT